MCHADLPAGTQAPPVRTREAAVPCEDGRSMPAFLAVPDATPAPAVLVVSDALGRSGFYEHLAMLLAGAGFVACAPDYFFRTNPLADAEPETRRARRRNELDEQQVLRDLRATMDWLAELPEVEGQPLGVIGFCMGGTLALDVTAQWPPPAATVAYYGYPAGEPGKAHMPPPSPLDITDQLHGPILAFWGDQDPAYDAGLLDEFARRLDDASVAHTFVVYPGIGHGFMREYFDAPSAPGHAVAAESWQQTLAFLSQHLGGGSPGGPSHAR